MRYQHLLRGLTIAILLITIHQTLFARELKKYRGEITIPIVENDFVYARNNAFQTLQGLLLSAAIEDLIGESLYSEYRFEISKDKSLSPSNFLVSAKVLKEEKSSESFYMELEGEIDISALSDNLRNMNLILLDDPWFPVTVLVESNLNIQQADLKKRLSTFHINIKDFRVVNLSNFEWEQRDTNEFIEALHNLFPSSRIIYLLDTMPNEDKNAVTSLRAQIFRMSDYNRINSFQLKLATETPLEDISDSTISSFLRMFKIQSIVAGTYNEGNESYTILDVEGLEDPYTRSIFENRVLATNRTIKSFKLIAVSQEVARYEINSSYNVQELESFFRKKNKDFYFITEKGVANALTVEAFYRYNAEVSQVDEWESDERILKLIQESLAEDEIEGNEAAPDSLFNAATLDESLIPQWTEREPNNSSRNVNGLIPDSLLLGYISSRADEDVYRIKRTVKSSTLIVEWTRIGKTTLSPQLRLYDQNFTFINNYNLIGSQNKLVFKYTFKETPPHTVYLRITDKVGFIQGETGGFKSFYYMLRCYWQTNGSQIATSYYGN